MRTPKETEPEALTDRELDLLAAVRGAMGPAPSDQGRVRAALATSLAAGSTGPRLPSESGIRIPRGISAGLQGLGWQVAAALFIASLGFVAGFWAGRRAPESHPVALAGPQAPGAPPALVADPPNPRADERTPVAPSVHGVPSPPASARAVEPRTLAEEAEALRRVGQALRDGQPALAKDILDDLDARIPRGGLSEERGAARVMVACRSNDVNAREVARTWLKRHPRSVYAPRVRASCLAEEKP
jgi:hypothetical protein